MLCPDSKKKANKKKKNANKNKELAQVATGGSKPDNDEPEDEPETPTLSDAPPNDTTHTNGHTSNPSINGHALAKLDAMGKEREELRFQVEELRKQLETIQQGHTTQVEQLNADLEESNAAKEHAEEEYQNLLGRVEKIKETLAERLKRDKAELEEAKERIEELEAENEALQGSAASTGGDVAKLQQELQDATREVTTLRSRNNLSAQNWQKERDELARTMSHLKEELETTSNAMGEWEVIAMEERSLKESLQDKASDYEDNLSTLQAAYNTAVEERNANTTLVDNLQNALREIQEARRKELREMVETTEMQLQAQKKLAQDAEARAIDAEREKESLRDELERMAPFEREVREKNLLIGKLRHEAIVLNDHLTKALRYLKKTKPEDNVDRYAFTPLIFTSLVLPPFHIYPVIYSERRHTNEIIDKW